MDRMRLGCGNYDDRTSPAGAAVITKNTVKWMPDLICDGVNRFATNSSAHFGQDGTVRSVAGVWDGQTLRIVLATTDRTLWPSGLFSNTRSRRLAEYSAVWFNIFDCRLQAQNVTTRPSTADYDFANIYLYKLCDNSLSSHCNLKVNMLRVVFSLSP